MTINVHNLNDLERQIPLHNQWLRGEAGGERIVCASGTDLSYANLRSADLSYANLSGADLSYAWLPVMFPADPRGYQMSFRYRDGQLEFWCGCHQFTYEQAAAHWLSDNYRDAIIGRGKMAVIDCIVGMFEAGLLLVKREDNDGIQTS